MWKVCWFDQFLLLWINQKILLIYLSYLTGINNLQHQELIYHFTNKFVTKHIISSVQIINYLQYYYLNIVEYFKAVEFIVHTTQTSTDSNTTVFSQPWS